LPKRTETPSDDDHEDTEVKVFSRGQLDCVLTSTRMPLLFELLACTGLRISEALALEWRHLDLRSERPSVKVRRGIVRGKIGPPKSRYGRRVVYLPLPFAEALRMDERGPNELVFPGQGDSYLRPSTLRASVLGPALEAAGCEWASFHTFRHTFASMHLARGTNLLALSRAMGHHSPTFTLGVYGHLLEGDEAAPLELEEMVPA
jgi:integrase